MAILERPAPERVGVALVPAGVAAVLVHTVLRGVGLPAVLSLGLSTAAAVAVAYRLSRRVPDDLAGALRRHALLSIAWVALSLGTIGATARLATFMVDESRTERSVFAFDEFFVHHSCLSAHFQSATLQRTGLPNIYEHTHYEGPNGEPKFLRGFVIDVFIYPPPFLLLSGLALALSDDFAVWRAVWFGLEGAMVLTTVLAVAFWIGGRTGRRAILLWPVIWLSLPLLLTLQFGNFQLVALAGSMLAMLAFERGRHALGGGILAAMTLGKIFPGILVLLLLFQRRWRSVAWTAGFGILILIVAWAVLGAAPFVAMISYNLPRLSTGAAVETQFQYPDAIAASHAVFGLVQKLSLLGVPGMSRSTAIASSWAYTGVLIVLVWLGARVSANRLPRALVWLALLHLASLRSPFTPEPYAQFPLLWMFVLLLAGVTRYSWRAAALGGLIVLTNVVVPNVPVLPIQALLTVTFMYQVLFLAVSVGVLCVQSRPGEAPMTVAVSA
jgi:alpha-1,2-mannosyltransferase